MTGYQTTPSITSESDSPLIGRPSEARLLTPIPRPLISIMVVDGQAVFRSGLARLLDEDARLHVVATSDGGPEVAEVCAAMSVDVLVTDLCLPRVDGIELIRLVRGASPRTQTLVLASTADWGVIPALTSGATGYLLKDAEPDAIMSAVVGIHLGEQVLCREATSWVSGVAPTRRLTRRELDVLHMIVQGAKNKEIAERLQLGEKTVRNYVSRLYRKLAVHSRAQIAAHALHAEGAAESRVHRVPPAYPPHLQPEEVR